MRLFAPGTPLSAVEFMVANPMSMCAAYMWLGHAENWQEAIYEVADLFDQHGANLDSPVWHLFDMLYQRLDVWENRRDGWQLLQVAFGFSGDEWAGYHLDAEKQRAIELHEWTDNQRRQAAAERKKRYAEQARASLAQSLKKKF